MSWQWARHWRPGSRWCFAQPSKRTGLYVVALVFSWWWGSPVAARQPARHDAHAFVRGVDTTCVGRDNTLVVFGVLAVVAAIFAALFALASGSLLCENRCEGTRGSIRSAQETVAIMGILPAVLVVTFAWQGRTRWALIALAVGLLTYVAWGVLLELLTHSREHGIDG